MSSKINLEQYKNNIIELYVIQNKNCCVIAKIYKVSANTINRYLKKCNIILRQSGTKFTGYKEIYGKYWGRIKRTAKRRNISFEISIEEAWQLYINQNRTCPLSGDTLKFSSGSDLYDGNASLDRINSNQHYTKDNCQWVTKEINIAKNSLSDSEFITMCEKVINHSKSKN